MARHPRKRSDSSILKPRSKKPIPISSRRDHIKTSDRSDTKNKSKISKPTTLADYRDREYGGEDRPLPSPSCSHNTFSPEPLYNSNRTSFPASASSQNNEHTLMEFIITKNNSKKGKRKSFTPPQGKKKRSIVVDPPAFNFGVQLARKISLKDLRDLVLWILSDGIAPTWISVVNRTAIKHVVFLLIPGLSATDFGHSTPVIESLSPIPINPIPQLSAFNHFSHIWPTRAPGSRETLHSPINSILTVPIPKKDKMTFTSSSSNNSNNNSSKLTIEDLLMQPHEFTENDYPTRDTLDLEEGWVITQTLSDPDEERHIYALDCEMCRAKSGSVLTRVSLVNWQGETIIDELVKPEEEIIDYVTRYSGITKELLLNVKTNLKDIQLKFLKIIDKNDILIGHSLENDFKVLKLIHLNVIDTSIIFGTFGLPKPSLRYLSKSYLFRIIQSNYDGHSSIEDSIACLDLIKGKLEYGSCFGKLQNDENIFSRLSRSPNRFGESRKSAVIEYTPKPMYRDNIDTCVCCMNDDEIINGILATVEVHDFVLGRLRELEYAVGWATPHDSNGGNSQSSTRNQDLTPPSSPQNILKVKENINSRVQKLYDNLPSNTALIITSGSGDPREMKRLQGLKKQFQIDYQTKKYSEITVDWNDYTVRELQRQTQIAREAVSFLTVKL